jgi:acetyl-CoA C-acetyltransferase
LELHLLGPLVIYLLLNWLHMQSKVQCNTDLYQTFTTAKCMYEYFTFLVRPGCLAKASAKCSDDVKFAELIDEVLLGHVVSAGCGQAPATQAIRLAGLPVSLTATTVNKVCASGMKAVSMGANLIKCGDAQCILAGGMESMSQAPFMLPKQLRCPNRGLRYGNGEFTDVLALDGLIDAETKLPMGESAERIADRYDFSREELDAFSMRSYEAAIAAQSAFTREEIFPIIGSDGKTVISEDDGPRTYNPSKLATLRTPFRKTGRITAATSSPLTDGAAVMLLMSGSLVRQLGIAPLGRIVACADGGVADAMDFPLAPVTAVNRLKVDLSSVDLFEINEAFAVAPMAFCREIGCSMDQVNVMGGALAIGHPLGASGARIIGCVLTALKEKSKKIGCAAICNGGGGASSIVVELLADGL